MNKEVAVVLVNYKDYASKFLIACRDSLRAQTYPAQDTKIYIVDNASSPESFQYLQKNYPEAKILSRKDANYSAANNLGFKQAIIDGCQYLVTVNMDTEVTTTWLQELVIALERNSQAGIAQSKILLYPKTEEDKKNPKINSLGNIVNFLGFGFTSAYLDREADHQINAYPEIKGYASGCSFIIRKNVLEKVGFYEEEFYMYHDDLEISLKVRLAGYKIILAPKSRIFHKYEFSRSVQMVYYLERNRYLFLLSFYPWYLLLLIALPGILMETGLWLFSILHGWFSTKVKIVAYFCKFKTYVRIYKIRRNLKRIRVIPFSKIASDFSGQIEFEEIANPLLNYVVNPVFNLYWRLIKKII